MLTSHNIIDNLMARARFALEDAIKYMNEGKVPEAKRATQIASSALQEVENLKRGNAS